jgi:uncharacterized membrane protein
MSTDQPDMSDAAKTPGAADARVGSAECGAAPRESDVQLEARLGAILRAGVMMSSACLAAGLVLSLATPFVSLAAWLMTAGLVLLMATPVARVAASVFEYRAQRDWTFFTLTAIVLLELCAGIVAALVFHRRL